MKPPMTAPIEALRELIAGLDDALNANYLPEQRHGLKLDALFAPHIRFFIAWRSPRGFCWRWDAGCNQIA